MQKETMILDVHNCARCGCEHLQLEFEAFTHPHKDFGFWVMCPVLEEPILLTVTVLLEPPLLASKTEVVEK